MVQRRFRPINFPVSGGAEVNDLSVAVVWANVPDANITQSSVTQYEANLTILESQITGAEFSNWDTAFGWGDHAGLYVDLAAGGSIDVDAANGSGLFTGSTVSWTNRGPAGNNAGALLSIQTHPGDYYSQLWFNTGSDEFYFRSANAALPTTAWQKIYHTGNLTDNSTDWNTAFGWGDHSGLYEPADTDIVKADVAETISAKWTFSDQLQGTGLETSWGITSGVDTGAFNAIMGTSSSATWLLSGTSGGVFRGGLQMLDASGTFRLYAGATEYIQFSNGGAFTTTGSIAGIADANLVDKSGAEAVSGEWSVISVPRNKTASYTMVLGDAGQTVRFTGATASKVCTIPANSSVAYPIGTLICVENDGSVTMTLVITTDTLTWSADNTTGTRTLAAGASCVIHKVTSTAWKVNGSALVT